MVNIAGVNKFYTNVSPILQPLRHRARGSRRVRFVSALLLSFSISTLVFRVRASDDVLTSLRGDANAHSLYSPLAPALRSLELASACRASCGDCRDIFFPGVGSSPAVGHNRYTSTGGLRAGDLSRRR